MNLFLECVHLKKKRGVGMGKILVLCGLFSERFSLHFVSIATKELIIYYNLKLEVLRTKCPHLLMFNPPEAWGELEKMRAQPM